MVYVLSQSRISFNIHFFPTLEKVAFNKSVVDNSRMLRKFTVSSFSLKLPGNYRNALINKSSLYNEQISPHMYVGVIA